jgi:hypothetical protein
LRGWRLRRRSRRGLLHRCGHLPGEAGDLSFKIAHAVAEPNDFAAQRTGGGTGNDERGDGQSEECANREDEDQDESGEIHGRKMAAL